MIAFDHARDYDTHKDRRREEADGLRVTRPQGAYARELLARERVYPLDQISASAFFSSAFLHVRRARILAAHWCAHPDNR
jgi:hypothetical protein